MQAYGDDTQIALPKSDNHDTTVEVSEVPELTNQVHHFMNSFLYRISSIPRRVTRYAVIGVAVVMLLTPAQAAFHLWTIREIYSDASGNLQFIELFTTSGSEQFVIGQQIVVANVGNTVTHSLTVPANLAGSTANRALLFGTASLQAAGAPAPDFIIPNGFLFPAGGSISFFGANSGSYSALPIDGIQSRIWTGGNQVNSPQNYAGQIGTVVPEPGVVALATGALGVGCLLLRRRQA